MYFIRLSGTLFLVTFLSSKITNSNGQSVECPLNIQFLCNQQNNCKQCVRAHPCCHWCYAETNFTGKKCALLEDLKECKDKIEINLPSSFLIRDNKEFTQILKSSDASQAIQLKPQSFDVQLKPGFPQNITFHYRAAKNYPLELYYLGDLSYSMRNHLETLKNLGDDLGRSLENLTLNYRLAYGSFLDKPGMPFFYTDPKNMENPCQANKNKCEPGYLFKHRLNFTDDTEQFFEKVRNSKISANVDDLDGALEAIAQILICDNKFGWSKYSRKFIVLSTDSLLHTAGDGILAGATLKNEDICLVDNTGNHTEPLKYDYPSVGQIKSLLRKYKVNLIIAVTKEKIMPYERMERDVLDQEAFVGELEENSKNILELVNTGFYDFIRQAHFIANSSHAPELEVKFFGDCYGYGHFNETSSCYNVEENKLVTFRVQFLLKEFTDKLTESISIREKNLKEDIEINIKYVGSSCECTNYENLEEEPNCTHGTKSCGFCDCEVGWTGEDCSTECIQDIRSCRLDDERICSARGVCECGKCSCDRGFTGEFCQFECFVNKHGAVCNNHGTCFEGVCNCFQGYSGDNCSCETSTDACKISEAAQICSGHGVCECNKCICEEGYAGNNCQLTKGYNIYCELYETHVKEYLENKTVLFHEGETNIIIEESNNNENCENSCYLVYFSGTAQRCSVNYCYHGGGNGSIHIETGNKKCVITQGAMAFGTAFGIFVAIILGGLFIIILKKWQIHKQETAEYKKFMSEEQKYSEMNPIYRSPVTEFRNPIANS